MPLQFTADTPDEVLAAVVRHVVGFSESLAADAHAARDNPASRQVLRTQANIMRVLAHDLMHAEIISRRAQAEQFVLFVAPPIVGEG